MVTSEHSYIVVHNVNRCLEATTIFSAYLQPCDGNINIISAAKYVAMSYSGASDSSLNADILHHISVCNYYYY